MGKKNGGPQGRRFHKGFRERAQAAGVEAGVGMPATTSSI